MSSIAVRLDADRIDLARFIRPGDRIVCGQMAAEPLSLTEALVAQRHALGGVQVYVGALASRTFRAEHRDALRFASYGVLGRADELATDGDFEVQPTHYSELSASFEQGRRGADVVLLQLAPPRNGRGYSLGLANDYTLAAARRARVVIAEVNHRVPWTHGAELPPDLRIDALVEVDRDPVLVPASRAGDVETRIGLHAAALIPDGATVQTGIGALPDAVLAALSGHRDLGLHSGMAGDRVAELIEAGVINNARKTVGAGISVTNQVAGTARIHRIAQSNSAFTVRELEYSHGAAALAMQPRLVAINSALEVDLTGQVNSEVLGGRMRGGVGGLNDFARAARRSAGGCSLIVLPSTAGRSRASRIVARLSAPVATLTRSDADRVVTEWGVADLRDCDLNERARRMIAIAAPEHRDELAAQWLQSTRGE